MEKVLKKLGWKGQGRAALIGAPRELREALRAFLPDDTAEDLSGTFDFVLYFATTLASVRQDRQALVGAMAPEGRLWLCYPKKTSRTYQSDLSRDILWPELGDFDYEPVSQFAVDKDWSAMRFRPVDEIKRLTRQSAASEKGKQRLE